SGSPSSLPRCARWWTSTRPGPVPDPATGSPAGRPARGSACHAAPRLRPLGPGRDHGDLARPPAPPRDPGRLPPGNREGSSAILKVGRRGPFRICYAHLHGPDFHDHHAMGLAASVRGAELPRRGLGGTLPPGPAAWTRPSRLPPPW